MTALRADGEDGSVEFDWESVTITRKGRRAKKNPPLVIPVSDQLRVVFRPPKGLVAGRFSVLEPGEREPGWGDSGPTVISCVKQFQTRALKRVSDAITYFIESGCSMTNDEIAEYVERDQAAEDAWRIAFDAKIDALMNKANNAIYGGHVVDGNGYRYGLGVKRDIAGATAEFESGADRSRPTLTRIGAGALLAGPVGAVAGGLFKKEKSKGYVTITFPDGAYVIVDGPAKDEKKLRAFAKAVTSIGETKARRAGTPAAPAAAPAGAELSVADQLLKLKELEKAGVLTEEQYAEKAAPLIARL